MPLVKEAWHSLHQAEFLVPRSIFRGRCVRNGTVTEGLGNQGELVLVSAL